MVNVSFGFPLPLFEASVIPVTAGRDHAKVAPIVELVGV